MAGFESADGRIDHSLHIIKSVELGFDAVCEVWLRIFTSSPSPTRNFDGGLLRAPLIPEPRSHFLGFEMIRGVLQVLGMLDIKNVGVIIVVHFDIARRALGMEFFRLVFERHLGQVDRVALLVGGFWVCRLRKERQPLLNGHGLSEVARRLHPCILLMLGALQLHLRAPGSVDCHRLQLVRMLALSPNSDRLVCGRLDLQASVGVKAGLRAALARYVVK